MMRGSRRYRRWLGAAVLTTAIAATAAHATPAMPLDAKAPTTARTATQVPATWITEQVNVLLSNQLSDGAILGPGTRINPYFANIGAFGLIRANTTASRAGALKWMKWYLAHLNAAAPNVPANSVYDYDYDPASHTETPTGDFDSVDSYASTTLNLAYMAYTTGATDLQSFVRTNITTYEAIANLLDYGPPTGVRIQPGNPDADLTMAKPSYPIAYTMDNAEVYSGLSDFAQLEANLGRTSQSNYYRSWATTTKNAITTKLWNTTNNNWDWAYLNPSGTSVFYPEGVVQLWPIIFGVVAPTDPKATAGWSQFTTSFPTWYSAPVPDAYPWVSIARAAQIMGDAHHADDFLTGVHSRYAPGFTQPTTCGTPPCGDWYDAEAGWFILAAESSPALVRRRG